MILAKPSASSFKRFTSKPFQVWFSLFLCTYYLGWMSCLISFEPCQSSNADHGTSEHYKKSCNLVHGRIRTTNTARPPDYKSTVITTRQQLASYEKELLKVPGKCKLSVLPKNRTLHSEISQMSRRVTCVILITRCPSRMSVHQLSYTFHIRHFFYQLCVVGQSEIPMSVWACDWPRQC